MLIALIGLESGGERELTMAATAASRTCVEVAINAAIYEALAMCCPLAGVRRPVRTAYDEVTSVDQAGRPARSLARAATSAAPSRQSRGTTAGGGRSSGRGCCGRVTHITPRPPRRPSIRRGVPPNCRSFRRRRARPRARGAALLAACDLLVTC